VLASPVLVAQTPSLPSDVPFGSPGRALKQFDVLD
jgi:hypothetical protein